MNIEIISPEDRSTQVLIKSTKSKPWACDDTRFSSWIIASRNHAFSRDSNIARRRGSARLPGERACVNTCGVLGTTPRSGYLQAKEPPLLYEHVILKI